MYIKKCVIFTIIKIYIKHIVYPMNNSKMGKMYNVAKSLHHKTLRQQHLTTKIIYHIVYTISQVQQFNKTQLYCMQYKK